MPSPLGFISGSIDCTGSGGAHAPPAELVSRRDNAAGRPPIHPPSGYLTLSQQTDLGHYFWYHTVDPQVQKHV